MARAPAATGEMQQSAGQGASRIQIPSVFAEGYEKAAAIDPDLAARYVACLQIADPAADAMTRDLAALDPKEAHRFTRGAIELDDEILREAPRSLRDFIHEVATVPAWYDREAAQQGCRAFLRNADHILAAFVAGAIVEGFATMISKSFAITGRLIDDGVRRLKQNIRHLLDMFLPRGIEPSGDGWKLTLRIRMVHARVRWLFRDSDEWDHDSYGVPISAAHTALAAAAFSARLLDFAPRLGASLDRDDLDGIMEVWCYCAWLMGVPDEILFHNRAEGLHLFRVGSTCEPPPDYDAVALAHCIVNSAPVVIGISDPRKRQEAARYIFRVSRELIGDATADKLRFPPGRAVALLPWLRTKNRLKRGMSKVLPVWAGRQHRASFLHVLGLAELDDGGFSYDMPDHAQSDRSQRW